MGAMDADGVMSIAMSAYGRLFSVTVCIDVNSCRDVLKCIYI